MSVRFKTAMIASIATAVLILTVCGLWLREPLYLVYKMRASVPEKQRRILYQTDSNAVAGAVRRFAAEQRWSVLDKTNSPPDFYYGDDQRVPASIRALEPSWVEIDDDHVDIGCGLFVREQGHSFGISVWRDGVEGSGTKKLGSGIWYYSEDGKIPSRFHLF